MGIKVELSDTTFASLEQAKKFLRECLYNGPVGEPIHDVRYQVALNELFFCRPEKVSELKGLKVVGWKTLPALNDKRCFAAMLGNGSHVHFSLGKSVRALAERQAEAGV